MAQLICRATNGANCGDPTNAPGPSCKFLEGRASTKRQNAHGRCPAEASTGDRRADLTPRLGLVMPGPRAATSGANAGRVWEFSDGVFGRSEGVFEPSVRPATGSSSAGNPNAHALRHASSHHIIHHIATHHNCRLQTVSNGTPSAHLSSDLSPDGRTVALAPRQSGPCASVR